MSPTEEKAFEEAKRGYQLGMEHSHDDCLKSAIEAYLHAVNDQPVAYVNKRGDMSVPDGSPLPDMLKALPKAVFGEEVLPLYAARRLALRQQESRT